MEVRDAAWCVANPFEASSEIMRLGLGMSILEETVDRYKKALETISGPQPSQRYSREEIGRIAYEALYP